MRRFTQIKGLSQARRLPRLGKIRLGEKVVNRDGKSYPRETAHFVVPPEVACVHGEKPVALDIMLPVEDIGVVFPQSYEFYGSSRGLKCTGDGDIAMRTVQFQKELNQEPLGKDDDPRAMIEVPCTCQLYDTGKCKQRAHLMVVLPKVSVGGVYQVDTGSYNSIVDLNSSIDYVRALVGRVAMVPLKLVREPRETHHDGMKQIHYTLRIEFEGDVNFLNQLRQNTERVLTGPGYSLPAPELENPELDSGATVVSEEPEVPAPPPQLGTGDTPMVTATGLLGQIEAATTIDEINEALDLVRSLPDGDQPALRKAAAGAVTRVTGKNKNGSATNYRKASGR